MVRRLEIREIVNASRCPPRPIGGLEAQRLGERVAKRNGGLSAPQCRGLVRPIVGAMRRPLFVDFNLGFPMLQRLGAMGRHFRRVREMLVVRSRSKR